ncbi:MAG: 50S ribosomal protein L15 [Sedimentisphaerales bacterium]|nr:50S ribosomal protein L15 [Sedimentisphaerales bacterium]
MLNFEITSVAGKSRSPKRIGRGRGSGHGKTCGRGHKGSGSRAGSRSLTLYEGGQMPLFRRLPKRGFSNYRFATHYEIINVCQLERFDEGAVVDAEQLHSAGLVDSTKSRVKVLGDGELTKKLQVWAHKFSKNAEHKIMACGGKAEVIQ